MSVNMMQGLGQMLDNVIITVCLLSIVAQKRSKCGNELFVQIICHNITTMTIKESSQIVNKSNHSSIIHIGSFAFHFKGTCGDDQWVHCRQTAEVSLEVSTSQQKQGH